MPGLLLSTVDARSMRDDGRVWTGHRVLSGGLHEILLRIDRQGTVSIRTERVGAMIREALGNQFQRHLPDYLDGMITVVSVKMSPDLSVAKVYVSIFRSSTNPDILIKRMNSHMPEIRRRLAQEVTMKSIPELRFYRDDTLDAVERINDLLKSVRGNDENSRSQHNDE